MVDNSGNRYSFNNRPPIKTYAETDIIKDSGIWEYLQYLQLNRINFLSTTIFDTRQQASSKLLNMISAIDQLEFLCWDKLKYSEEYLEKKPLVFKQMRLSMKELRGKVEGDSFTQLQLKLQMSDWLREINPALASMKRIKRVNFISGEGEEGEAIE